MTFHLGPLPFPITSEECQTEIEQCEKLGLILKVAGAVSAPNLSYEEIDNAGDYIKYLATLHARQPVAPVKFRNADDAQAASLVGTELLWLESFKLGSGAIAFAAIVVPTEVDGDIVSSQIDLKTIRYLSSPLKEFDEFEKDAKKQQKLKHSTGHRPVERDGILMAQPFFE